VIFFFISNVYPQINDTLDVIKKFGYKGENYRIKTADGYLLTIQRIFSNKVGGIRKPPCLIMHGIFSLSLQFLQLRNDSVAFILANNGYDVFLGNARGTKYSSHVIYPRNSSQFWNFSHHEIGYYDLPAMIDTVLAVTKSKKLFYIASSQGAAISMVLLSTRPEFNQKIIQAHYLGPAIFLGGASNLAFKGDLALFTRHKMVDLSDVYSIVKLIYLNACDKKQPFGTITCILQELANYGLNINKFETDFYYQKNYVDNHAPAISIGQFKHFKQISKSRKFQYFDYGDKNIRIYGSKNPPEYNLGRVTVPIYIYWGTLDSTIDRKVSGIK
jgi:pimeloyl-ACP methyl ester carboxylesterase